jgi:hypothetical protein
MKTFILTENQFKRVIGKFINEQKVNEFMGSTDANKISHSLLSTKFGLPEGLKHENFYYEANVADVLKMSTDPSNRNNFLSIFTPKRAYSENKSDYVDYFQVNNKKITGSGTESFNFLNGTVIASHNGLLALTRAMELMGGKGGLLTINIGKLKTGPETQSERISQSVSFNPTEAFNLSGLMSGVQDLICSLAISPKFLKLSTSKSKEKTTDEIETMLPKVINNIIIGSSGFMDNKSKNKFVTELTPMGLITKIDFDVKKLSSQLKFLQSVPDLLNNPNELKKYNENKKRQLSSIGLTYQKDLVNKIKEAYTHNFKLYVNTYLPNSKNEILPKIPKTVIEIPDLGYWHYKLFHTNEGTFTPSKPPKTEIGSQQYQSGS